MKKIIGLLLILFVAVGCSSNNSDNSNQTGIEDGVLTVGLECDYAPYNWTITADKKSDGALPIKDTKDYCEGYDVEIAQLIAEKLDVKVEIAKMTWDGLIPALNSNQIDLIIAGMSPTEERKKNIDFSDAYYKEEIEQVVIVRKDSKYANATKLTDFEGAKITAQVGTMQVDMMDQMPGIIKEAALPDYASMILALKNGSVDGYVAEIAVAQEHAAAEKDFKIINLDKDSTFKLTEGQTTTAIGIKKDNTELLNKVNEALKTIDEKTRNNLMEAAKELSGENK